MMKGRFTPEEWAEMKLLPFLLHHFLTKYGANPAEQLPVPPADPLHRELALDTSRHEWKTLATEASTFLDEPDAKDGSEGTPTIDAMSARLLLRFMKNRGFLRKELTASEHESYMVSVFLGHWVRPLRELPSGVEEQANEAFKTILAILRVTPELLGAASQRSD